jgi:hypothetical protein
MVNPLDRVAAGRANFARLLKTLLSKNNLTHSGLKQFHDWALPDQRAWLSTSQLSGVRTQKLQALGPRCFDSLGMVNMVLADMAGVDWARRSEVPKLPKVLPSDLKHLSESAWFVQHPHTHMPMSVGDLFEVWVGRLDPGLQEAGYSDRQARAICERVALTAQAWLMEQGKLPSQAREEIENICDLPSKSRRERLWASLMGVAPLKGDQLAEDAEHLRKLMGVLQGADQALSESEWDRWVAGSVVRSRRS